MNKEWNEGYQAYLEGAEIVHNPYHDDVTPEGHEKSFEWALGWECARDDSETIEA